MNRAAVLGRFVGCRLQKKLSHGIAMAHNATQIPATQREGSFQGPPMASRVPAAEQTLDLVDYLPDPPKLAIETNLKEDSFRPTHAVVSTFDLFSIGIGPSSSHSLGPMRAANIFIQSLKDLGVLSAVNQIRIALYGSLAATGKGHMTPQALLAGLEGEEPETVDPSLISTRFEAINRDKTLVLGGQRQIIFDIRRDLVWHWDRVLHRHPNALMLSVFDVEGNMLACKRYFSIGGGFVVPDDVEEVEENVFYKQVRREEAEPSRRQTGKESTNRLALPGEAKEKTQMPPYPFWSGHSLLEMTRNNDMTIAQICYENELIYRTPEQVRSQALRLWAVMNECIREGVTSTEEYLPGPLKVKRRARNLHKRLLRGLFPGDAIPSVAEINSDSTQQPTDVNAPTSSGEVIGRTRLGLAPVKPLRGRIDHPLPPIAPRRTVFPAVDLLSCYAIATNEVNAAGGRVVTAPTNGAAGTLPAVLKYIVEFVSDNPERDVLTFLFTSSAIGQLFKRGATISAAEGGCMAEVGVATAMAAAGFTAVMGGDPEQIERAAEIGIEHSLGLTCDPLAGQVQIPCIERNALGAVKAVTAAQLALASTEASHVSLDEAIAAMKQTANDMQENYKETSRSGLAVAVKSARVSVRVPEC